ncbi:hypothetical protein [Flavobacterium sp. HSC-61S13]|uniref:hypothetical protein n=1 Tax=Flavobacterium sp. HSC-61S13 TaxID=2910963 RepID=UPI0020A0C276|nr:hypothetical protein [Flavobacterium sp. HSC-61S13]MCP1996778.1 hypothetical protein [Flavobacterium sp. HSC-61S13]
MKKVLEADLLSIAHRILQMKNKEDIHNLYQESKELYEKLLILKFHEDNFNLIQPNIALEEIEDKLEEAYQEEVTTRSQMPVDLMEEEYPMVIESDVENHKIQEEHFIQDQALKIEEPVEESVQEPQTLTYTEAVVSEPFAEQIEKSEVVRFLETEVEASDDVELAKEEGISETETPEEENKADLEQLLNQHLINTDGLGLEEQEASVMVESSLEDSFFGIDYQDVDFVRVEDIDKVEEQKQDLVFEPIVGRHNFEGELPVSEMFHGHVSSDGIKEKAKSINDAFSSHITVSLNDRIAFEKNLFNGSSEDFNRVLSQINTLNTFDQAVAFIDDLVKPDYNYWSGKEEYVGRLMELIEKRFA